MFTVTYSKQARKALRRMPADTARRIIAKLAKLAKLGELAEDPDGMRNVKQLKGRPDYRLRMGDWRVAYRLERAALRIVVIDIDNRGRVYKR